MSTTKKRQKTGNHGSMYCPNPNCGRSFKAQKGLLSHLQQSEKGCGEYFAQYQFESNPKLFQCVAPTAFQQYNAVLGHSTRSETTRQTNQPDSDETSESVSDEFPLFESDSSDEEASIESNGMYENEVVHNAPNLEETNIPAPRFHQAFTEKQLVETRLAKLLNDANAPHFLFNDIMGWLQFAKSIGYDFEPSTEHRATLIRRLKAWLHVDDISPTTYDVPLQLTSGLTEVPVTTFDFEQMFMCSIH